MKLRYLHLSDFHFDGSQSGSVVEIFNRDRVTKFMLKAIDKLVKAKNKFDFIIITGDIVKRGKKEDYDVAQIFCKELLSVTGLSEKEIYIVPGNHDVDRDEFKDLVCNFNKQDDITKILKDEAYLLLCTKKLSEFNRFANETMGRQFFDSLKFCYFYPHVLKKSGKTFKINIMGLNSALFAGYRGDDKQKIALGVAQVNPVFEKLDDDSFLNIAFFHHPFPCFHPEELVVQNQLIEYADLILTGHFHQNYPEIIKNPSGEAVKITAGTCFDKREKENSFNFVEIDLKTGKGKVRFYKYIDSQPGWKKDMDLVKEEDGCFSFHIELDKRNQIPKTGSDRKKKKSTLSNEIKKLHLVFENYKTAALQEHRFLQMKGFETNLRTPIEIEQVYVNMHAHLQSYNFDYTVAGRRKWEQKIREEQISSLDIKKAIQVSSELKIKDMVILGDPGSGKTTLLKYILVMLLEGKAEEKLGLDFDIIPFFAPLRELKRPDSEDFLSFLKRVCCFERYNISDKDCQKLLDHKKGIVLMDGLDEVADEETRIKVCKWIDSARKEFVNTQFIVTSRFAGYLGKSRLEGTVLELSIQDFTPDEVKAFLFRWFETVEAALHPGDTTDVWKEKGRKDALELYKNIDEAPHLKKLAVNPLILQIIALIRRDRGTALPQRRVELYQECVNVLLEKWDMAKGLDVLIRAREARQILQPLALWLHQKDERRSVPLTEIINIIQEPLEELGKSDTDPEALLLNIRDRSGIFMGYSESEYGFAHLSFQEYLAAEEVRNTDKIEILIKNYGKKWWREVILLSLGLDNPSIIKTFMDRIIKTKHFRTDISLIIDAIDDSLKKPAGPFIRALGSKEYDSDILQNVVSVLAHIGGKNVVSALKEAVKSNEKLLARSAYSALKKLNASKGIKEPFIEAIPAILRYEKDDSEMVLVPAGKFLYGSRDDDKNARSNEKPQRTIHLDDFYIDVYPVTNRQFCMFLNETKPDSQNLEKWIDLLGKFRNEKYRIYRKKGSYKFESRYENHPVIYVSWYGAKAYADWAGKRLPTEQEWEKAARGTDGRIYPWSNDFIKKYCNSRESGIVHTTEVGKFPKGKSPYGCFDMSGNVWEWTASHYTKESSLYVLRGGSWSNNSIGCRCAVRDGLNPIGRYYDVGFRCART